MKHHGLLTFACVAALACGSQSRERTENAIGTSGVAGESAGPAVSDRDWEFSHHMLSVGTAEVEMARLAQDRSFSPDVRLFARILIDEHTRAGALLENIVASHDIAAQPTIDDSDTGRIDDLSTLRGLDFDKAFIDAMVDGQVQSANALRTRVSELRTLAQRLSGTNPQNRIAVRPDLSEDLSTMNVNQWAASRLPMVEHLLARAEVIQRRLEPLENIPPPKNIQYGSGRPESGLVRRGSSARLHLYSGCDWSRRGSAMKHHGLIAFACVAALTAGCNSAPRAANTAGSAGTSGAVHGAATGVSDHDKDFVNQMLSAGMAEIETARLAKDDASSTDVKQFAQMMIDDHTAADNLLMNVASTDAIPTDAQIDDRHMRLMNDLRKQHGLDFDKVYMDAMVGDHEDAVKALRSRVEEQRSLTDRLEGKNPEDRTAVTPDPSNDKTTTRVNEWAANTLPTVEHHLDRAKEIKDQPRSHEEHRVTVAAPLIGVAGRGQAGQPDRAHSQLAMVESGRLVERSQERRKIRLPSPLVGSPACRFRAPRRGVHQAARRRARSARAARPSRHATRPRTSDLPPARASSPEVH